MNSTVFIIVLYYYTNNNEKQPRDFAEPDTKETRNDRFLLEFYVKSSVPSTEDYTLYNSYLNSFAIWSRVKF